MIITVSNTGEKIETKGGNLVSILFDKEIFIDNPCNGRGTCGKCRIKIESDQEEPISDSDRKHIRQEDLEQGIRLACLYQVTHDITVTTLQQDQEIEVLTKGYVPDFEIEEHDFDYGIAVDIGTTTIALALYDMKTGEEIAASSMVNPQKKYGLDVLTRITHQIETGEKGVKDIQRVTVNGINTLVERVLTHSGVKSKEIGSIVVGANNTMAHALLGVDASSMGKFPFKPEFIDAQELPAEDIGLRLPQAQLYVIPQVSAFIGGDIVAGAYVSDFLNEKRNVLFIDIGTNGELVLAANGKLLSCSCAAGPALEGMNISHGMRAAEGAIESVEIYQDGIKLKTIADAEPIGICGSGILDVIKELLRTGIVEQSGAYVKPNKLEEDDWRLKYIQMDGRKREFVLNQDPEVIVSQGDVRQVQLAKGAILSGVIVLLREAGLDITDLDEILVAGQFGSHLSENSMTGTGILPLGSEDKINYIGNSSVTGAYMALMSDKVRRDMEKLAKEIDYIELAVSDGYEEIFRDAMIFPKKEDIKL